MRVQRTWTRSNKSVLGTNTMSVWDSGSVRYERLSGPGLGPDQEETCWKVIERTLTENGFVEILVELPAHSTPAEFAWKEDSPVTIRKSGFDIPDWTVEIRILKEYS